MADGAHEVDEAYRRLPGVGPHAPHVGAALITWVEPMPEHVAATTGGTRTTT